MMAEDRTDGGRHRASEAVPVPLPTVAEIVGDALSGWIAEHPNVNACGVAIQRDREAVAVYWKGTPPSELQSLAAAQPVPVSFYSATYSLADLDPVARQVLADHRDVVSSTGPNHGYSGISVTLWSTAPVDATMAELNAESDVPIFFWMVADPVDLTGNTGPTDRCGDRVR